MKPEKGTTRDNRQVTLPDKTTRAVPAAGALVLYRSRPARVIHSAERLEIDLGGEHMRVRPKDVQLLHPGPLASLSELVAIPGEMRAAWEILAGGITQIAELSELAFGRYSPATAWAAWQFVEDGLYFTGTPESIQAASPEQVKQREEERESQAGEERKFKAFIDRARAAIYCEDDTRYYREIEQLAFGSITRSKALRELDRAETPENAHALLLELGAWDTFTNPHPRRLGVPLESPALATGDLPEEKRLDLTGLEAYAIDDRGNETPDDALSLEGNRVWVHVADPAALATVSSPLDEEARSRVETLHLPEGHIHLFPPEMAARYGLGMQPVSPALSIGIDLAEDGAVANVEIVPSWVKVKRVAYEDALHWMGEPPLSRLEATANLRRSRREAAGAINIDLPEVNIRLGRDGKVVIEPVLTLRSRVLVEECMILAGEAVARYAFDRNIPLPFSTQDAPESCLPYQSLSGMFAMRRLLRRSQYRASPAPHSGLGLPYYVQATSPLRRYLDLVVHQQLRAYLKGETLLGESEILERIGQVEAAIGGLRQAEILSEKHWTLVYLLQNPGWKGRAVLVDRRGHTGIFLIPSLGLETRLNLPTSIPLDSEMLLEVASVDLAQLGVYFRTAI